MIVNVTSIRLRSWWNFFALSYYAMHIVRQTKSQPGFIKLKNTGFGYDHYTMSVWQDEESLRKFARTGAHLNAMKKSGALATEIRTYNFSADTMPNWKEVRQLLKENGKIFKF